MTPAGMAALPPSNSATWSHWGASKKCRMGTIILRLGFDASNQWLRGAWLGPVRVMGANDPVVPVAEAGRRRGLGLRLRPKQPGQENASDEDQISRRAAGGEPCPPVRKPVLEARNGCVGHLGRLFGKGF